MTDWTEELLGKKKEDPKPPTSIKDINWTEEVLRHPIQAPDAQTRQAIKRQQAGGVLLTDLPLANYDVHDDKWSGKGTVGFLTQSKAALVDDPATKLKIYAQELFPNDPNAAQRFGMVEGVPVYVGDDDKLYAATTGDFAGKAKGIAAEFIGRSPSAIGGAIGGTVASGSLAGTVAGAVAGAVGGEGVRKIAAGTLLDEPQTMGGNAWAMTKEGLWSLGGSLAGVGLAKWLQRNVARDIGSFDDVAANALEGKAKAAGVDLTPAEVTNLKSLRAQQKVVGGMPASSDIVDDFMQKRPGQVQGAFSKFAGSLSPEDSVELAGRNTKEAAAETAERLVKQRKEAAQPIYNAAFDNFQGIPQDQMQRISALRKKLPGGIEGYAIKLAKMEGIDLKDPANSLRGMHYMKVALDTRANSLATRGANNEARIVGNLARDMKGILDDISPQDEAGKSLYKTAAQVYEGNSPAVERAREGLVGKVANLSADAEINAPRVLFDAERSGPIAVKRAIEDIRRTDPNAANDALRGFLQDKFEKAGREYVSQTGKAMQGAKFRAAMLGNKRQADILKAAMTKEQWAAFNDLMEVFEATGRAPMVGSDTAWNIEGKRELAKQAGGMWQKAASLFSPQDLGNRVSEAMKVRALDKYAERVATAITSKDAVRNIKELKSLPKGSQARLIRIGAVLGLLPSHVSAGSEDLPIQQDQRPR
jgi:hypothetical protein